MTQLMIPAKARAVLDAMRSGHRVMQVRVGVASWDHVLLAPDGAQRRVNTKTLDALVRRGLVVAEPFKLAGRVPRPCTVGDYIAAMGKPHEAYRLAPTTTEEPKCA